MVISISKVITPIYPNTAIAIPIGSLIIEWIKKYKIKVSISGTINRGNTRFTTICCELIKNM